MPSVTWQLSAPTRLSTGLIAKGTTDERRSLVSLSSISSKELTAHTGQIGFASGRHHGRVYYSSCQRSNAQSRNVVREELEYSSVVLQTAADQRKRLCPRLSYQPKQF